MASALLTRQQATERLAEFKGNLAEYAKSCLVIRTKKAELLPLTFNAAQSIIAERAAQQLRDTGRIRIIVLKARQEGVSTFVAGRNFRRIHLYSNQTCLVVADKKKRAASLFDIYEMFHRQLDDALRPMTRYSARGTLWYDSAIGKGGLNSKITVETAMDVDVGRATTIQALHASELAFWENAEVVWTSLAQAVPDEGSEIWIESTANGVGNLFHSMWEAAVAGENGYLPIFLPWWVHEEYARPCTQAEAEDIADSLSSWEREAHEDGLELDGRLYHLTFEQLKWRRETIRDKLQGDERKFRQEYPSTAREAFLVSGNGFFDEDVLLDYERGCKPPEKRGNLIRHNGAILLAPAARGHLRVWEVPVRAAHYVIFADTATGRLVSEVERGAALSEVEAEKGGRDFSSADVVKVAKAEYDEQGFFKRWVRCYEHVAQLHGRIHPEEFARQLQLLGFWYSCPRLEYKSSRDPALVGVERNHSSGDTVVRELKENHRYPRLYYHRIHNNRTQTYTKQAGWVTTEANRAMMLDGLAAVMRAGELKYRNPDGLREMFTFVRDEKGKFAAQEGCHDDRVISIAGAVEMAKAYSMPSGKEPPPIERADTPTGY